MPASLVTITLPPNPAKSLSGYRQTNSRFCCSARKKALGPTGGVAEGARRRRDNEDAFRVNVREDIWKNGVRTGTWWISVLDCVDSIAVLVGHPNLTAVGPEA